MTKIHSPIGSRIISNQQREYIVDDATDEEILKIREIEAERKRVLEQRANPDKERMSNDSKKRIEFLLGLTTLTKTVEISKTKFVLRTLKSNEQRDSLSAASKYIENGVEYLFEMRRQILARSLVSIEQMSFDDFIKSSDLNDKLSFVDEMDDTLVKILHSNYDALFKESQSKFGINSDEQAKEFVEDLKK